MVGSPARATVTAAVTAERLGYTPGRVRQLLDDPNEPLDGPEPPGRGRVRLVYEDTIAAQAGRRPGKHARVDVASLVATVERLERTVAELGGRAPGYEEMARQLREVEEENRRLQFAKAKSDAAADALRDALSEPAEAARLRREAEHHDAAAMAALRRAEKARDDAT
jgi:hypothetical protein